MQFYQIPDVRTFYSNPGMAGRGKYPDPAKKISACPDIPWALIICMKLESIKWTGENPVEYEQDHVVQFIFKIKLLRC